MMKLKLILILILSYFCAHAKLSKKDSLLRAISENPLFDTTKVKSLNNLSKYYLLEEGNVDEALKTSETSISVAQKSKSTFWLGRAHSLYAFIKSNYTSDFNGAINSYFAALKCFEKEGTPMDIYTVYLNLGGAFYQYKELDNANSYFKKAEKLALQINDTYELGNIYVNLGGVNSMLNNDSIALIYYDKAKYHYLKIEDELGLAMVDFDIANIYVKDGKTISISDREKAIRIYTSAKDVFKKHEEYSFYLSSILSLGRELTLKGEFTEGNFYLLEAEKIALEINDFKNIIQVYESLANNARRREDLSKERDYLRSYIVYNDSLFQESKTKAITELQTKYETEKKEQENLLLTKDNEKKQLGIYFSIGALVLLLGVVFLIYRNSIQKTKTNKLLAHKNVIIEEQNKNITDSIKYAQRIQGAILPPNQMWFSIFPKSFVLYKPKDILSGDFYWTEETEDWKFVGAADCTGHGVPGALMSIVNFNLLNKAVLEKNLTMPGEILDSVNQQLTLALHQTYQESTVKDGMDITLLSINKKNNEVYFAGANNPIYILGANKDVEMKGDKFPVGAFVGETIRSFTTHKLELQHGDRMFLFSDGYADQFGGPKGKKLKYKQMKDALIESLKFDYKDQKSHLEKIFENWRGNLEQVDDVLIIGLDIT